MPVLFCVGYKHCDSDRVVFCVSGDDRSSTMPTGFDPSQFLSRSPINSLPNGHPDSPMNDSSQNGDHRSASHFENDDFDNDGNSDSSMDNSYTDSSNVGYANTAAVTEEMSSS